MKDKPIKRWTRKLENERVSLLMEKGNLCKTNSPIPKGLTSRLEVLQTAHGEWLQKVTLHDTTKVDKALRSVRRTRVKKKNK